MLTKWQYIIIATIICVTIWARFTWNHDNDWGKIPMLLRLPLLVVSAFLAVIYFFVIFSIQRFIPKAIEIFINIIVIIVCFLGGWDMEAVGNVVETVSGIIGDIIVSPLVIGFVVFGGIFPDFPKDRLRSLLYKILATIELSVLILYGYFYTENPLTTIDKVIFTTEVICSAIFVIRGVYIEYDEEKTFRKRRTK